MDMNVTIYLPDELGERVKKADLEVSRICQAALGREVDNWEAEKAAKKGRRFKRIEVRVEDRDGNVMTKAFQGDWLVMEMGSDAPNLDAGWSWSVALTKGGAFAVYGEKTSGESYLDVYDSLDDATDEPEDVLAAAASAMGVDRIIELDI